MHNIEKKTVTSYNFFIGYTEGWRQIFSLHILGLRSINWRNVRVRLVLHIAGVVVSEYCECVCYIRKNLQVYLAVDVVPI